MVLNELEPLQTFELDGQKYECIELYPGGRIASCYELDSMKQTNYYDNSNVPL